MQKVIPVGRKILIKQLEAEQFYPGTNIIIPDPQQNVEPKGHVVGVGEAVAQIKIGDLVQYSENASAVSMRHDGVEHYLINEGDIFAILVDA